VGFFKDLRKLNKMGKESYLQMDVAAQMEQASQAMAQAQQTMSAQTAAVGLATTGERATATITAVRNTGTLINYQPVVEIVLMVHRDGRPPYPTTMTDQITVENRMTCHPGREVEIAVDPEDPSTVWIDWPATISRGN
jgi:hypothetical protein